MSDRALYDYIPFLIELSKVNDMREAVTSSVHNNALEVNYAINVCLSIQEAERMAKRQKEIEMARVRKAQQQSPGPDAKRSDSSSPNKSPLKNQAISPYPLTNSQI
jgi:hypothetical protein